MNMNDALLHPDDYADLCGDGHHNEYQRAHAHSLMTQPIDQVDSGEVEALLARGRVVVVVFNTVYCRSTDGILGRSSRILFHTFSREAAYAELNRRYSAGDIDRDDQDYVVLPNLAAIVADPVEDDDENNVPF